MVLKKSIRNRVRSAGFTLVELVVVAGIISVVSAIVLANSSRYGGQVLLQNLAYDIALSIRQAQIYGLSVARYGQGQAAVFSPAYGVHFSINADASAPASYALFADVATVDGLWSEAANELIQSYRMRNGYRVVNLCVQQSGAQSETCNYQKLDITFARPEPDAYIRADGGALAERARIQLESPKGDRKSVTIDVNGQIGVETP